MRGRLADMNNTRTEERTHLPLGEMHVADEMVPRVSTLIAKGALLQDRRLQVSESGEVRWVGPTDTIARISAGGDAA